MIACPRCGAPVDPRLLPPAAYPLRPPVARYLARREPSWQPAQGLCPTCALQVARAFARTRSAFALHTRTEPHTTFPYYHPDEETVLGLAERLPGHDGYDGQGTTLGFLDSGYYPHPDLAEGPLPEGIDWERLTPRQWRARLEQAGTRLADYIDLSGDRDDRGLHLPSLWDGAGVAWHGQMTTVIAAGSGALSRGTYRGYASGACLLPIKIGRGDGRIPETDILEGFEWLLRDRRWERLGLRVLNVSIGGDFPQDWRVNAVCRAAERLAAHGVLIVAAAGNSPVEHLLAPAQAPSILTVGGIDDQNRALDPLHLSDVSLYHHGHERVAGPRGPQRKPELLAPAAWLAGPILPVSPVFREMHAIDRLRATLRASLDPTPDDLVAHWQRVLHDDPSDEEEVTGEWMGEVWQAVRRRMNTHKWVHACYQHVDGTSVAAAVVSGVAAQMAQANPALDGAALRALLGATALPLPHLPAEKRGAGVIQPAAAVAAALRAPGGRLAGLPRSGTLIPRNELQNWVVAGRVPLRNQVRVEARHALYVGLDVPQAARVWLTGDFDGWRTDTIALERSDRGWWHAAVLLPPGEYLYRFWVEAADGTARWLPDPENPLRAESGYTLAHSKARIA